MEYRKFGSTGVEVSALGLGAMRLPLKTGGGAASYHDKSLIDEEASVDMMRFAIDGGVNYIDTAYTYVGGASEEILGRALAGGYREKVHIATKSTLWLHHSEDDFEKMLTEQQKRLNTDFFDFYMLHGVNKHTWHGKALKYGAVEKLFDAKRAGRVGHVGFSFHDDLGLFREMCDYAPWDFCQIQLNYLDTAYQAGLEGLRYAAARGMGVVIMEPMRGGYLASVPDAAAGALGREKTPVEHALDFLWDLPEVSLVLSGMCSKAQAEENIRYASRSRAGMLSEEQRAAYGEARRVFESFGAVPCTGCAYCMHCPRNVAIPYNFAVYNEYKTSGDMELSRVNYQKRVPLYGAKASECVGCRACEELCPQHLPISEWMPRIDKLFG